MTEFFGDMNLFSLWSESQLLRGLAVAHNIFSLFEILFGAGVYCLFAAAVVSFPIDENDFVDKNLLVLCVIFQLHFPEHLTQIWKHQFEFSPNVLLDCFWKQVPSGKILYYFEESPNFYFHYLDGNLHFYKTVGQRVWLVINCWQFTIHVGL